MLGPIITAWIVTAMMMVAGVFDWIGTVRMMRHRREDRARAEKIAALDLELMESTRALMKAQEEYTAALRGVIKQANDAARKRVN